MARKRWVKSARELAIIILGTAVYSLGFDLFLQPNQITAGGLSGFALLLVTLTRLGTVGLVTAILNVPLFLYGYRTLGRRFFIGSLVGTVSLSLFLDLFTRLPVLETEPLLGTLYGGILTGLGVGLVIMVGASTGGTDMMARLIKLKNQNISIGKLLLAIDAAVVLLTGIVFWDINKALYSAVTLYVCSLVVDGLIYGMDSSPVALIITDRASELSAEIVKRLARGVTAIRAQGGYTNMEHTVLLCAIKKNQTAELKAIVMEIDSNAFMIFQEAHQVLGFGFKHYSKQDI